MRPDPSPHGDGSQRPTAPQWVEPAPPWPTTLPAGLSTRLGGISPPPFGSLNMGTRTGDDPSRLADNLARLAFATRLPLERAARIRLEHGTRALWTDEPGVRGDADALLTRRPGLPLALTVADCYPVVMGVPGRVAALLHCGWRSTAGNLVGVVAETLRRYLEGLTPDSAALPRDGAALSPDGAAVPPEGAALSPDGEIPSEALWAWIGPGIGPCCFEVGPEVADRFPPEVLRFGDAGDAGDAGDGGDAGDASYAGDGTPARPHVDLPALLEAQLREAGVAPSRLRRDGRCTVCQRHQFFSHRGDGGRTGRMLAWTMLTSG